MCIVVYVCVDLFSVHFGFCMQVCVCRVYVCMSCVCVYVVCMCVCRVYVCMCARVCVVCVCVCVCVCDMRSARIVFSMRRLTLVWEFEYVYQVCVFVYSDISIALQPYLGSRNASLIAGIFKSIYFILSFLKPCHIWSC